jgi:hypothetical protein
MNIRHLCHFSQFHSASNAVLTCLLSICTIALPVKAQAIVAPAITPPTGSYLTPVAVELHAPSGTIRYTVDGTRPDSSSPIYSTPLTVSAPTQINAIAYQSGTASGVTTAFVNVNGAATPILQSGLQLWLSGDFGVVTSIGSPGPVTQWTDLSGLGNSATSSAGNQPGFTGTPTASVAFNGTSQYLSLPSGFTNFSTGATIFIVARPSTPGSHARFFDLGNGSSNNIYMSEPSTGSFDLHVVNGSTDSSVTASSVINLGQFQLVEGSYNGTNTGTLFTNGAQDAQSTSMQAANYVRRSSNFIGQASGSGNYFPGQIAELLLYSTQLTSSQISAIQSYLIQKYQLLSVTPSTPIISVAGGTLSRPTQVAIASQPGASTYFTTDGSTPSSSTGQLYCGCPLTVNFSQTIKAISILNGVSSSVASATYTLDSSQWPAPSPTDTTAPTINLQLPVASQ